MLFEKILKELHMEFFLMKAKMRFLTQEDLEENWEPKKIQHMNIHLLNQVDLPMGRTYQEQQWLPRVGE